MIKKSQFRLIEILLLWEGGLSAARVRGLLDVTPAHMSHLLADYRKAFPGFIQRNHGAGRGKYIAGNLLMPTLSQGNQEEYFAVMGESASELLLSIRTDYSAIKPRLFGLMHHCAEIGMGLQVRYHSMNRPEGIDRVIYPHTLVQIGTRWHARAWDSEREDFRDFNLARISAFQLAPAESPKSAADDEDWNTEVHIRLVAHEALAFNQARLVEVEYFEKSGSRRIVTRAALLHYTIQGLRAAVNLKKQRPPEFLLQVKNIDELSPWLLDSK